MIGPYERELHRRGGWVTQLYRDDKRVFGYWMEASYPLGYTTDDGREVYDNERMSADIETVMRPGAVEYMREHLAMVVLRRADERQGEWCDECEDYHTKEMMRWIKERR